MAMAARQAKGSYTCLRSTIETEWEGAMSMMVWLRWREAQCMHAYARPKHR